MPDFTLKSFDRLPSIQAKLTVAATGAAVNLGTATGVDFIMRADQGGAVKVNSPAVIVDATGGVVRYDWAAGDTDNPGTYSAEWEVHWPGGLTQTFPTATYHSVAILADLDGAV